MPDQIPSAPAPSGPSTQPTVEPKDVMAAPAAPASSAPAPATQPQTVDLAPDMPILLGVGPDGKEQRAFLGDIADHYLKTHGVPPGDDRHAKMGALIEKAIQEGDQQAMAALIQLLPVAPGQPTAQAQGGPVALAPEMEALKAEIAALRGRIDRSVGVTDQIESARIESGMKQIITQQAQTFPHLAAFNDGSDAANFVLGQLRQVANTLEAQGLKFDRLGPHKQADAVRYAMNTAETYLASIRGRLQQIQIPGAQQGPQLVNDQIPGQMQPSDVITLPDGSQITARGYRVGQQQAQGGEGPQLRSELPTEPRIGMGVTPAPVPGQGGQIRNLDEMTRFLESSLRSMGGAR